MLCTFYFVILSHISAPYSTHNHNSFFGDITPRVQASILQMHPDCTIVADEAALKLVDEKFPGAVK